MWNGGALHTSDCDYRLLLRGDCQDDCQLGCCGCRSRRGGGAKRAPLLSIFSRARTGVAMTSLLTTLQFQNISQQKDEDCLGVACPAAVVRFYTQKMVAPSSCDRIPIGAKGTAIDFDGLKYDGEVKVMCALPNGLISFSCVLRLKFVCPDLGTELSSMHSLAQPEGKICCSTAL